MTLLPTYTSGRPPRAGLVLALALGAASATAQFTDPYNGVGRSVRSTPLPIVVMRYEPNTPFDHNRYALYGRAGGQVLHIAKDRDSTYYKRVEVPFVPGVTPADDPVPFRNPNGSVASMFVLGSDGRIYQATTARYQPFGTWSSWSPLPGNVLVGSSCAAVNTPDGLGVSLFALGRADRRLYNAFYSRSSGRWTGWLQVTRSPALVGRPTCVNSSDGSQVHVLATDTAGAVRHVTYTRGSQGGWSTWQTLSGSFRGSPSSYVLGSLLSVFATGTDGRVYQAVHSGGRWGGWSSLGGPSAGSFVDGPSAVNTFDDSALEIVCRTSSGQVERRVYTRGAGGGWSSWAPIDVGGALSGGPTLANWHSRTSTTAQTRAQLFDPTMSVAHWFRENSFGQYTVREAYISPWLVMPDDPDTPIDESSYEYLHGGDMAGKARLMISAFEGLNPGFRFADYDSNGDGTVDTDELMVFWIYPGRSARVRGAPLCIPVPSLSGCGVSLDLGLPRAAAHVAPATICEELCHALFGLDDLYATPDLPNYVDPGRLTLISNNAAFPHLHPWGKLKLGWVPPTVVRQDGWHRLRPIERHQDMLVVHDPGRGTDDYLLVENRIPDGTIEHALPDRGIGVWRIGEHYGDRQAHWGRKTIKLLRAGGGTDDTVAFWDASDPRTAYHLTPTSAPADTLWDGGLQSHVAIYNFPTAGPDALVFVDMPPLRTMPPPPHADAGFRYLDQRPPFSNPSPNWLTVLDVPRLGTTVRTRVPMSFVQGTTLTTYYLATGFTSPNIVHPVFDGYWFSSLELVSAVPFGPAGLFMNRSLVIPADPNLSGFPLYQQVLRVVSGQPPPLGVSRGARLVLGY